MAHGWTSLEEGSERQNSMDNARRGLCLEAH